jgi:hypothetical protein
MKPVTSSEIFNTVTTNSTLNRPRLPDFIIAGAQKSGTTSLHNYLARHRQVYLPMHPQELHFFDHDPHFRQGMSYYQPFFEPAEAEQISLGQTSPLYIYDPKVPPRIVNVLPQVKLIFILRNPVDRAYSHYWHSVKKGYESLSFEEALKTEPTRLKQDFESRRRYSYVDRGYYCRQLERFLQHFAREQLLILLTEDLSQETAKIIDQCCDFLAIESQGREIATGLQEKHWNTSGRPRIAHLQRLTAPWRSKSALIDKLIWQIDRLNLKQIRYPAMKPTTQAELEATFAAENARLATLFDLDLSAWSKSEPRSHQIKDSL